MEAQKLPPSTAPAPAFQETGYIHLTQKFLLLPYCLMFVAVIIVIMDAALLGGLLKKTLPTFPDHFFLYWIVFNYPHIMASHIVIFNSDYVSRYKHKIMLGIAGSIALAVAIPLAFGYTILLLVYGILTVNHVLGQQAGLARIGLNRPGWEYLIWKYSGLIVANIALHSSEST
jgi:hypothetical protein